MLYGAPPGWSPQCGPDDWNPTINRNKGEPLFEDVDNPGGWSLYTFRPMFEPRCGKYICHAMPAGAVQVPINAVTGKREGGENEFFYQGWKQENPTRECHVHGNNLYGYRGQVQTYGIEDIYIQSTYIQIICIVFGDHQNTYIQIHF